MRKVKKTPSFKSEREEAEFWASHDTTDYVDWKKARRAIFPGLKPTSRAIPLRLPAWLITRLKFLANKHSVSYQALMRSYLEKRVHQELRER